MFIAKELINQLKNNTSIEEWYKVIYPYLYQDDVGIGAALSHVRRYSGEGTVTLYTGKLYVLYATGKGNKTQYQMTTRNNRTVLSITMFNDKSYSVSQPIIKSHYFVVSTAAKKDFLECIRILSRLGVIRITNKSIGWRGLIRNTILYGVHSYIIKD